MEAKEASPTDKDNMIKLIAELLNQEPNIEANVLGGSIDVEEMLPDGERIYMKIKAQR